MNGGPRGLVPLLLPLLLLAAAACDRERSRPARPDGPERVAVKIFDLARTDEPTDEELLRWFDARLTPDRRAELLDALDALDALGAFSDPRVTAVEPLSGPDEVAADLTAELAGGGSARFSVQLRAEVPGSWRITWFQGPGVEWPAASPRGSEGSSSSMPPEP